MAKTIQVEINAKDNISRPLDGVAGKIQNLKARVEGSKEGMNKLGDAFKDAAKDSLQLNGAAGQLAESLMAFAGGSLIVTGVVAGIGLIAKAWMNAKEAAANYAKEQANAAIRSATERSEIAGAGVAFGETIKAYGKALEAEAIAQQRFADATAASAAALGQGNVAAAATSALLKQLEANYNNAKTAASQAKAAAEDARDAQLAASIATFASLTELSKRQALTIKQLEDLKIATERLQASTKDENATRANSAFNALNATQEQTKAIEKSNTVIQNRLPLLQQLYEADKLTNAEIFEMGRLESSLEKIVNNNNASLESRVDALRNLGPLYKRQEDAEALNIELIQKANDARKDYIDSLIYSIDVGIRSEELTTKLQAILISEEGILQTIVPLTAEWADQSTRLADIREALVMAEIPATFLVDAENTQKQIDLVKQQQTAMLSLISNNINVPESTYIDILVEQLIGLQAVYQTTQDVISQAAIAQEIETINNALLAVAQNTTQYKVMTSVIEMTAESFTLLAESVGKGKDSFPAFGRAFAQMISGYARQKAALQVGESLENVAKGISAASNPLTAPLAAGFFAAAAKHAAAAAAFGIVAGGASNIAGQGGGGGGAQSNFGQTETSEKIGDVTVIFPDGLIDLSNPATQRQFSKLINEIGGNRQITYSNTGG